MKTLKMMVVGAAIFTLASCASFTGASAADRNGDGMVSKAEASSRGQQLRSEGAEQNAEFQRFKHVDDMMNVGADILRKFGR